jgi:two-component system, NtrC family, response regulator AtoC
MNESILVVDSDESMRIFLTRALFEAGYNPNTVATGAEALQRINIDEPDLTLINTRLPDMNAASLLQQIQRTSDEIPVIITAVNDDMESAAAAVSQGAANYLSIPFTAEQLTANIKSVLEHKKLQRIADRTAETKKQAHLASVMRLISEQMRQVNETAARIAQSDIRAAMIWGQNGAGKKTTAKSTHFQSKRSGHPFIEINCLATPEMLLESDLFGYGKGAFTDARKPKRGILDEAVGGTVYLEEIDALPSALQDRLAKFLETGTFQRLGGKRDIAVDVRIIASTRSGPEKLPGLNFSSDLLHRLNLADIHLPPLTERPGDITPLAKKFALDLGPIAGKKNQALSPEANQILLKYNWPGNIRELRNVIERAVIISENETIHPSDLRIIAAPVKDEKLDLGAKPLTKMVDELEQKVVTAALEQTGNNQVQAAKLLGVTRDILRYRMKRYHIQSKPPVKKS